MRHEHGYEYYMSELQQIQKQTKNTSQNAGWNEAALFLASQQQWQREYFQQNK